MNVETKVEGLKMTEQAALKLGTLKSFDEMEPAEQIKRLKDEVNSLWNRYYELVQKVEAFKYHEHGALGQVLVPIMENNYIRTDRIR